MGQVPPLTPNFDLFSDACLRPCSTGRWSTDPERPWLRHYPILSLTGFLQSRFLRGQQLPRKKRGKNSRTGMEVY